MNNVKKYITFFKNVTFEESSFNDVDNILLSMIVYLDLKEYVKNDITLYELGRLFFENNDIKKYKRETYTTKKAINVLELMHDGDRYKNIVLSNYVKIVDDEKQFCAVTYVMDDTIYVAYEGTDDTIVGWKEDFQMFYQFPVPSQKLAIDYLNNTLKYYHHKIIVGGHSKGGNLAMTASMYARSSIKRRIVKVYNNDGPGFRKKEFESKEYKEMLSKLRMIIPEESIIGLLLRHTDDYTVVKSKSKNLYQHIPSNWQCYGSILLKTELSTESKRVDNWLTNWLDTHNDIERKKIVLAVFNAIENAGINKLSQIKRPSLNRIVKLIKASRDLDSESKELFVGVLKVLFIKEKNDIIE